MRKASDLVNAAIRARLGGEPVLSVVEGTWIATESRKAALQEAIAIAEQHGARNVAAELRKLVSKPASGGAND